MNGLGKAVLLVATAEGVPWNCGSLEPQATSHAVGMAGLSDALLRDNGGLHSDAEVGTNVEDGQMGVDIGIDHGEQIYAREAESTEVAIAAIVVLLVFEYLLELFLAPRDVVAGWEHFQVTIGIGVVVHNI